MSAHLNYPKSPFHTANTEQYLCWKKDKLQNYPATVEELVVPVEDPFKLSEEEHYRLTNRLLKANMVIYALSCGDFSQKSIPEAIGKQLGINQLDKNECADNDSFTSIQVTQQGLHNIYIPYSNKPLNWHTDGYYNKPDEQIYSMLLHCVRAAPKGGENLLLDHDIAYMLLRDKNSDYIQALMADDAMTIPKNILDGKLVRPDRAGPVFRITEQGRLHMRYTARARNVIWKDEPLTQAAQEALRRILTSDSPYHFKTKLEPGQGLICNNILHTRNTFKDDPNNPRLLYRGRYLDKIELSSSFTA